MKAVVCTKYVGSEVLQIQDTQMPQCSKHELLIKIMATAVNSADVKVRSLAIKGVLKLLMQAVLGYIKPRKPILGTVYSGVVEEVGESVAQFIPGNKVFGSTGFRFGTNAEFLSVNEKSPILPMPKNASFEEAVPLFFGEQSAHYFLEKAGIFQRYKFKVSIICSTGSLGIAATQIARCSKAEITAVCSSSSKTLMKELRIDKTILYDREDFIERSRCYDIKFDAVVCTKRKFCRRLLKNKGKFISVDGLSYANENEAQLEFLKLFLKRER